MKSQLAGPDERLCAQAQAGNRLAEEQLVRNYTRMVRACARPYFLVGGDSEDLLQEGMIGLLSAIRGFQPERGISFRNYAETCVQNGLRSAVRSAARSKHIPLNQAASLMSPFFASDIQEDEFQADTQQQEDPEDLLIFREEEKRRFESMVVRLSSLEKTVLQLYLEGFSQGEIAERIHRPAKSVENAVQRIRRKIASYFITGDFSVS